MANIWARARDLLRRREGRPPDGSSPGPSAPFQGPQPSAAGHNDFALSLYGQLRRRPGNLFFSPYSVRAALAMAYAGARGETAAEMRDSLRLGGADEDPHAALAGLTSRLNSAGGCEVAAANSLWCQSGEPLLGEFLDLVAGRYGGFAKPVDFRHDAAAAREAINGWVKDRTGGRIRDLIPPSGLNPDTRLVVANAVYFKGAWQLPFPGEETRDDPFRLEGGGMVRAPLMHHRRVDVRYLQARGFQAVELDYAGGDLSMIVLLPEKGRGLRGLEEGLTWQTFHEWEARMRRQPVDLYLPRFRMVWGTADLAEPLRALGMAQAFSRPGAVFSGINGHAPPDEEALFISAVFHQAFVELNEEGTEAAAATATSMHLGAALRPAKPPPVPVFRADRPFLFAIRECKSGAVLFLGRVADPTRES